MTARKKTPNLTTTLEDCLETIFRLINERGEARIEEIAAARDVKPHSISAVLQRLAAQGLVELQETDGVRLSRDGVEIARRIYARHRILKRFFESFLGLSPETAEADACAAEHVFSEPALDRLVRFFEYLEVCPDVQGNLMRFRFKQCALMHAGKAPCPRDCPLNRAGASEDWDARLIDLVPGRKAHVLRIDAEGTTRQHLLDKGVLPGTELSMVGRTSSRAGVRVGFKGDEFDLSDREASAVWVEVLP